jgi:hypothetical protein
MNHLLLLSAVLIVGLTAPAYGQTLSENIVINEVDTNPPGDDSQLISEWVELYNPTSSDVDISGWQIASTTVLKKTLAIPDGTIISSGDFLTFTYEKIWFTDSNELIELKNSDNVLIDSTPLISDLQNDFSSWQRSYDGYDDWEFSLSSAGGSNGQFIETTDSSVVIITASSDKTSYVFDDTAIIQGSVSEKIYTEKPYFQTEPIQINISGQNYYQTISLYPDYNLNYQTSIDLVQVLGISEGTYNVTVTYAGISETISFSVGFETIGESEQIISSFFVETDKSEYVPGELISINGLASEIIPFESIEFTITDSIGTLISNGNLFPSDGAFSTNVFLSTVNPNYGVYTISVQYGDLIQLTSFNVVENISDSSLSDPLVSDSITLNLDQSQYLLNDYMTLYGDISNFDSDSDIYYQVVYFNFKASDGTIPTMNSAIMDKSEGSQQIEFTLTAIPDKTGAFSINARLPQVVFLEGDYSVKANYGGMVDVQHFSVISESSSDVDASSGSGNPNSSIPGKDSSNNEKFDDLYGRYVSNVQTIVEKVNRISDNLILISTQEKILNDYTSKPRVLSGSMITSPSDQSDVNLQVMSESGICIVGQNFDCLVNDSTRKPGQIFEVVQVDGLNLNVRYSGPDVRLEKFSILPQSSDAFLPDTNWNVEVIKDDEVSRFYYKVTYKTLQ